MKQYRVTEILEKYVNRQNIPDWRWDAAGDRGSRLHACISDYLNRVWTPNIDIDVEPYFDSFESWAREMILEVVFVEKEFICPIYGIIGHPDCGAILKPWPEVITVPDWKSPVTEGNTWKVQCGTYHYLVDVYGQLSLPVERCGALMLNPKGKTAKFIDYSDEREQAFQVFLNALNSHRWLIG